MNLSLIEEGQVFYSKLYGGRVTYLSKEFYANMKPYRQRLEGLSPTARAVYDFLSEIGTANTEEIKRVLLLSSRTFTQSMNELFRELLVTAIRRDRTMNENWSSFEWGTYKAWEELHPVSAAENSRDVLEHLTKGILTKKKLLNLLK